jgi:hypothetical protein
MMTMEVSLFEEKLIGLLTSKDDSLGLHYNDFASFGMDSVSEAVRIGAIEPHEWLNEKERAKAIETNQMWTLVWNTQEVSKSSAVSAHSLEAIVDYIMEGRKI